jgi:hypothetical protein
MGRILLSMSVSLDGFAAGPDVSAEHPMGKGGERLHEWLFHDSGDRANHRTTVRQGRASTSGPWRECLPGLRLPSEECTVMSRPTLLIGPTP